MGVLKGILLVIFSFLLIVSLLTITTLYSANQLIYPEPYIDAFEKNNFYETVEDKLNIENGEGILFEEDTESFINEKLSDTLAYIRNEEDELDLGAGIILDKKVGDMVEEGETLACMYINDMKKLELAKERLLSAYTLSDQKPVQRKLIHGVVTKDGVKKF